MSRRTSPPQRLSAWMRAHYDELRPEQPFDAKRVAERVRELGITDRAGRPPSRAALTMAWSRERKRRKAQAASWRGRPIPLHAAEAAAREANEHFADVEHWTEPAECEEEAA